MSLFDVALANVSLAYSLFVVDACTDLAFRVLINLTDGNTNWSETVVSNRYSIPAITRISLSSHAVAMSGTAKKVALDEEEESTKAMDRLCLALALLTNLLQEVDSLALSMQEISEQSLRHRFPSKC